MESHKMNTRQASGNCEVWRCTECKRVLIFDWKRIDSNPIVVLRRGNDTVVHSPNLLTDEDKQWIDSHDIAWDL